MQAKEGKRGAGRNGQIHREYRHCRSRKRSKDRNSARIPSGNPSVELATRLRKTECRTNHYPVQDYTDVITIMPRSNPTRTWLKSSRKIPPVIMKTRRTFIKGNSFKTPFEFWMHRLLMILFPISITGWAMRML